MTLIAGAARGMVGAGWVQAGWHTGLPNIGPSSKVRSVGRRGIS